VGFQHLTPSGVAIAQRAGADAQRARWEASFAGRFWARVARGEPDACWPWRGELSDGYGALKRLGKRVKAHATAYRLLVGDPGGLHVLHHCDNRACCNPAHLFTGTNLANVEDKVAKGRQHRLPGEANGRAKLTAEDVQYIRASSEPPEVLAVRHGVTYQCIRSIQDRITWRHVA